jgi:hypothetical protein
MCKGVCDRFDRDYFGVNHYCQQCAKFINKKYLKRDVFVVMDWLEINQKKLIIQKRCRLNSVVSPC